MSESNNTASLGCGTLILIALIVMIFGNKNEDQVREIQGLRQDIQQLTEEVRKLQPQAEEATPAVPGLPAEQEPAPANR